MACLSREAGEGGYVGRDAVPCILLVSLDCVPGSFITMQELSGVFSAGDPGTHPQAVEFPSTTGVMLLL